MTNNKYSLAAALALVNSYSKSITKADAQAIIDRLGELAQALDNARVATIPYPKTPYLRAYDKLLYLAYPER